MLQLRVQGDPAAMAAVADALDDLPGTRHVALAEARRVGGALVTADVSAAVADRVLQVLSRLGVPAGDVVLVRLDEIGAAPEADSLTVVWADLLGEASLRARAPGRYLMLMASAGVVAAFAVLEHNSVLIVGAMAISPDLLPIMAACTGLVLRRGALLGRGLGALAVGLAVTGAVAAVVTAVLHAVGHLPAGFALRAAPAGQSHVSISTVLVALSAGVAGMLAFETRGSAAVGVAISVTTVPAIAYLGVAAGVGELDKSLYALSVLGANVAMILVGGAGTLAAQRLLAARR